MNNNPKRQKYIALIMSILLLMTPKTHAHIPTKILSYGALPIASLTVATICYIAWINQCKKTISHSISNKTKQSKIQNEIKKRKRLSDIHTWYIMQKKDKRMIKNTEKLSKNRF